MGTLQLLDAYRFVCFFICAICFHFCNDVLYLVQLNVVLAVKSFAILILGQLWPDKENS